MFFQNVFNEELRLNWLLGDRQYVIEFPVPANVNSSDNILSWNAEPFDFSVSGLLTIGYAWDTSYKNFSYLSIDVSGATPGVTKAQEVVDILNNDSVFSSMWVAKLYGRAAPYQVQIVKKSGRVKQSIRTYIDNADAESILRFNKKAAVVELPSYFERHTIDNRFVFSDSIGLLIKLDTSDPIDQAIITDAGLDYTSPKEDWEFLSGRSGLFTFRKLTVDGSGRITEVIEYPAGASEGNLAKKINYAYSGMNTAPDQITEIPYTLQTGDLVTP